MGEIINSDKTPADLMVESIRHAADQYDESRTPQRGNPKKTAGNMAVDKYERELVALDLRLHGYSAIEIQHILREEYKWDYKRADSINNLIRRAMRITKAEKVSQVRTLELMRLDKLMGAHWEQALDGNIASTQVVLKIMAQRTKLLGLDAPIKVAKTDSKGRDIATLSDEERMKQIAALINKGLAKKQEAEHAREAVRVGDGFGHN